jgi:formylglycine-generating enzyme required for sulfatase activity
MIGGRQIVVLAVGVIAAVACFFMLPGTVRLGIVEEPRIFLSVAAIGSEFSPGQKVRMRVSVLAAKELMTRRVQVELGLFTRFPKDDQKKGKFSPTLLYATPKSLLLNNLDGEHDLILEDMSDGMLDGPQSFWIGIRCLSVDGNRVLATTFPENASESRLTAVSGKKMPVNSYVVPWSEEGAVLPAKTWAHFAVIPGDKNPIRILGQGLNTQDAARDLARRHSLTAPSQSTARMSFQVVKGRSRNDVPRRYPAEPILKGFPFVFACKVSDGKSESLLWRGTVSPELLPDARACGGDDKDNAILAVSGIVKKRPKAALLAERLPYSLSVVDQAGALVLLTKPATVGGVSLREEAMPKGFAKRLVVSWPKSAPPKPVKIELRAVAALMRGSACPPLDIDCAPMLKFKGTCRLLASKETDAPLTGVTSNKTPLYLAFFPEPGSDLPDLVKSLATKSAIGQQSIEVDGKKFELATIGGKRAVVWSAKITATPDSPWCFELAPKFEFAKAGADDVAIVKMTLAPQPPKFTAVLREPAYADLFKPTAKLSRDSVDMKKILLPPTLPFASPEVVRWFRAQSIESVSIAALAANGGKGQLLSKANYSVVYSDGGGAGKLEFVSKDAAFSPSDIAIKGATLQFSFGDKAISPATLSSPELLVSVPDITLVMARADGDTPESVLLRLDNVEQNIHRGKKPTLKGAPARIALAAVGGYRGKGWRIEVRATAEGKWLAAPLADVKTLKIGALARLKDPYDGLAVRSSLELSGLIRWRAPEVDERTYILSPDKDSPIEAALIAWDGPGPDGDWGAARAVRVSTGRPESGKIYKGRQPYIVALYLREPEGKMTDYRVFARGNAKGHLAAVKGSKLIADGATSTVTVGALPESLLVSAAGTGKSAFVFAAPLPLVHADGEVNIGDFVELRRGMIQVAREVETLSPDGKKRVKVIYYRNGIDMEFVEIVPGVFKMGAALDDEKGFSISARERPSHEVRLTRAFFMGAHEVTTGQYLKVMGVPPAKQKGKNRHGDLPVTMVTWSEAKEFCQKLTAMDEKWIYRLPSEAEWEYACRAGTTTPFYTGKELGPKQAVYYVRGGAHKDAVPTGSYAANPWGLFEMHGNVYEWTADGMREYNRDAQKDPHIPHGDKRVIRGGSWDSTWHLCRSASRSAANPAQGLPDIGFRIVMEPKRGK